MTTDPGNNAASQDTSSPSPDPRQHGYWKSLAQLQGTAEFQQAQQKEFPSEPPGEFSETSRRRFLQVMGASTALAAAAGCRSQVRYIAPYVERPEGFVPGEPLSFSTSIELSGVSYPLQVTSYDFRPIKVEGNPYHPFSQTVAPARGQSRDRGRSGKPEIGYGSSSTFAQASILELYDPDRLQAVYQKGAAYSDSEKGWREFRSVLENLPADGSGLRVLAEPSASPTLARLKAAWQEKYPQARWVEYEPLSRDNERLGVKQAYGESYRPLYKFEAAKRIVCLDADPLGDHPAAIAYSRDFVKGRDPDKPMNRLYVAESAFSKTGAVADHRLPIKSSQIRNLLVALETALQKVDGTLASAPKGSTLKLDELLPNAQAVEFVEAMAEDLASHPGQSLICVGVSQPAEVHALACRLNQLLGGVGKTIHYLQTEEAERPAHFAALKGLAEEINDGSVKAVIILGGNPAYDAPADLDFGRALSQVEQVAHLTLYPNETTRLCRWALPRAHSFESWGDGRSYDGTLNLQQPLIEPLYQGRSAVQLMGLLLGDESQAGEAEVRKTFEQLTETSGEAAEKAWRKAVHDGFRPGTNWPSVDPAGLEVQEVAFEQQELKDALDDSKLEVTFLADSTVYDGRYANLAWLQELPDFLTKLTWDNAALISPATAKRLKVTNETLIKLTVGDRVLEIAAYVMPGQAANSIALPLGYGRTAAGRVGGNAEVDSAGRITRTLMDSPGFDTYKLRTSSEPYVATSQVELSNTRVPYSLATTQDHHTIDEIGLAEINKRVKPLVRQATVDHYSDHRDFAQHVVHLPVFGSHSEHAGSDHAGSDHAHDGEQKQSGSASGASSADEAEKSHQKIPEEKLQSLWEEWNYQGHAWGMAIDLNKCTGCNACVVACQSENNIPVVGKEQVLNGREMHWIRIDRYFHGDPEQPAVAHQPVACQQCENAPCEQVCPVTATIHSHEGLNDMVYNRCVGTRYCSNNCPYKVRRFNFFYYHWDADEHDVLQMAFNPQVTVRSRGVMEKCTFCVQRIQQHKISAKVNRRELQDQEIVTACQQACPTQAIVFGDLNDPKSVVRQAQSSPRAYGILAELNTKPRNRFLAKVTNPNQALVKESHDPGSHG